MSEAARNLIIRNEVETMSTTTISQHSCTAVTRRPAVDILVERLARRLLAWTTRRQQIAQPSHERMALIRGNERLRGRALGTGAGSPLGR
jgi:hypothetical protein